MVRWLKPEVYAYRRLLVEFMLGANHHQALREIATRSDAFNYRAAADLISDQSQPEHQRTFLLMHVGRNIVHGMALIADLIEGLSRPVAQGLFAELVLGARAGVLTDRISWRDHENE
jgi:hypothetical protein